MINTAINTFKIDLTYSINSFVFNLSKLPILKDLITEDIYKSRIIKIVLGLIVTMYMIISKLIFKLVYFFILYSFATSISNDFFRPFLHIYLFLSILGMFINNKEILPTKRKYISTILFNMDGNKLFKQELITNLLKDLLLNAITLSFIINLSGRNLLYIPFLLIFTMMARVTGETLNIIYYRKKEYFWYSNTSLYLFIVLFFLGLTCLPIFEIIIPVEIINIIMLIIILIGIISFIYVLRIEDFKIIYKNICIKSHALGIENPKEYQHQMRVEVKEKDKEIDSSILEKKKGYDLFNTIFFERHKEILLRSAKKCASIILLIYIGLIVASLSSESIKNTISILLQYKLSFFIIIMYFINRGAIITQAMFFNCDHAMLTYNFYREPKVILNLFKKRILTVVKVNLIPAIVIAIGNDILLLLTSNNYTFITLITAFIYIIFLSVFFSVHYMVMYYLLQPYNKSMQLKKFSYSLVSLATYIISYSLKDLVLSADILSVLGIIFVLSYIIIALLLIYKVAPKTFKINN